MGDQRHYAGKTRISVDLAKATKTTREKLKELSECNKVLSDEEIFALGRINHGIAEANDNVSSSDEVDEILEAEFRRLNDVLDLPVDTYSLTKITPNLPTSVKYGIRSGLSHQKMDKFSPLSRGLQGPAIAIAAFATTALVKARCWNELIIDQIVDDGDTYYCESYELLTTDDRRSLTVLDLKKDFLIQKSHQVYITIDDPAYAGTFRSDSPTNLHLAKALELFFKRYDAGVLTSKVLNIAIWKDHKYLNIFDGQPREDNLLPTDDISSGSSKLILVRDLIGLLFIILEKSEVKNEHFVLYGLGIRGLQKLPAHEDDPEEPSMPFGDPKRRPSGYKIQNKFRALVQGSFHLKHNIVPAELRGQGHLVIALAALIYSRLVNANKWTNAMIDLIFNQAHIYLVDLARVLEKKLDETFELKIDDVMADVILGVYAAKVKVHANVVPGQAKKGKATIDTGIREFFMTNNSAVLEIKKTFYAVWKDGPKFYLLDPFACDDEGFRVEAEDPENVEKYKKAVACVTMNSSIDQLIEIILENTGNKEKDPFFMHGLEVLYVKTGSVSNGPLENVIYREKKTNRRPVAPEVFEVVPVDHKPVVDMVPKQRADAEKTKETSNQYPELMKSVNEYVMKDDEPTTFVESEPDTTISKRLKNSEAEKLAQNGNPDTEVVDKESNDPKGVPVDGNDAQDVQDEVKFIKGYNIINPHRIILHGSKNCLDEAFEETSRGRQGLTLALTAIAYAKIKNPTTWRNIDIDQILQVGDRAYSDLVTWIRQGSPNETAEGEEGEEGEEEQEDEDDDEQENEEGEDEEVPEDATKSKPTKPFVKSAPSHIDVSMLPDTMKLGENALTYKKKLRLLEGEADPLANLGEALEHYLQKYNEVILENKKLMYGVWKQDDKYFLFNTYGSDEEGWRLRDYPASLIVTDTINELTDSLHGILEFNDRIFSLHFVGIESIQPGNKFIAPVPVVVPEETTMQLYRTKFLPVTDQDLFIPKLDTELEAETTEDGKPKEDTGEDDDGDNDDEEDEDEEAREDDEDKEVEAKKDSVEEVLKPYKPLEDPLQEIDEQEGPHAPDHLNLALLTGSVKIEKDNVPNEESKATVLYEKLKYNHPAPYVLPPKKVLNVLLEAKKASQSMHSLISRFSIDSKLAVKAATDLPSGKVDTQPAIATVSSSSADKVKMIKLPPTKYIFSRVSPEGFTPIRAINEKFIQDEDLDKVAEEEHPNNKGEQKIEEYIHQEIPEDPIGIRITPEIIPLGPTINTPTPKKKTKHCADHSQERKCNITESEKEDKLLEKMLCNTEDVLFDIIFPSRGNKNVIQDYEVSHDDKNSSDSEEDQDVGNSSAKVKFRENVSFDETVPETLGFLETENNVGIIEANTCLHNRGQIENYHFKQCFFAAILCILAKVRMDVNLFRGTILDQFIVASNKIFQRTGKLRYKPLRWFHNIVTLGVKCNVVLKQSVYADPESTKSDELSQTLETYIEKNKTGILVCTNASYAFWFANDAYYLFDPYACDEKGVVNENGYGCLLKFCKLEDMIKRIKENNGEPTKSPYRIYSLSITHMEPITMKKKPKQKQKRHSNKESETSIPEEILEDPEGVEEPEEVKKPDRELSLTELAEWVNEDKTSLNNFDMTLSGFAAVKNFNASALEVIVVENDITRPVLASFKKLKGAKGRISDDADLLQTPRKKPYDRKFTEQTSLAKAVDLCIIAWSCVHNPTLWSVRTVRGIYEASRELTFDSLLAAKDSTVTGMIDGILTDFSIANYSFKAVFAPLHNGTLYAPEGWNLAMSLKKLFDMPIYSGAIVVCGSAHIGVMKKGADHYAWWAVPKTKKLRIMTSEVLEDFLRLIVMAINENEGKIFAMRPVTISYARKLDPDCSDVDGLHETVIPMTSLPQIHRKKLPPYDLNAIFQPTMPIQKPIFILGTVAFRNRDNVTEPRVKRCYFVAVLSVMVKRDIIQSPIPGMIDKVIQVAENLYNEFDEPKYHTEHILRNVTVMNRLFDFRDCASALFIFKENSSTEKSGFYSLVRKQLKIHLNKHTDGIIHFTNCCYGFWHCRSTNAYYYIDPYPCNFRGTRVDSMGKGCLGIFPSICQMARQMCLNRFEDTTGFFIHRLHVETINVPPFENFQEDPMWVYLDYHWSFSHSPDTEGFRSKKKKRKNKQLRADENNDICEESEKEKRPKPAWNNYAIEVTNLIYSVWGSLGCYDTRFGERAGDNQAAVCLSILAMQYLCHPSKWGAAILDSAVICGDSYYTESLKTTSRRGSNFSNRFNLQPCFKVFPHIWLIEFCTTMCGILYGARDRACLATTLKLAFEESSNVVLECGKVTLALLSCADGFYVADPCWTGPPLFFKNHGAVYALRCRNYNALIYAITKMLNTNQKLEFQITPVIFTFSQEYCKFADLRGKNMKREILLDPLGLKPGTADGPDVPVPGAITVRDEDTYLSYRKNISLGISHGTELEDPPIRSPLPYFNESVDNLFLKSTEWHLNIGQDSRKKRSSSPLLSSGPGHHHRINSGVIEPRKCCSIYDKIQLCDDYPRTIDLVTENYSNNKTKILTGRKVSPEGPLPAEIDCLPPRKFLKNSSRRQFRKCNKDMADEAYKSYKHRLELDVEGEEEDLLSLGPEDENIGAEEVGDRFVDAVSGTNDVQNFDE